MKVLALTIETAQNGKYWGRVQYDDNLLVDSAGSLETLQKRMKKLLLDFHDLGPDNIQFELQYDLTALFEQKNFLNVSAIVARASINASLMRQYVSGTKYPSLERVKEIEKVILEIGRELSSVKVGVSSKKASKSKSKRRTTA